MDLRRMEGKDKKEVLIVRGEAIFWGFIALILYSLFLGRRGVWVDELTTYQNTLLGLRESIMERFRHGHMPLYFMIEWFWTHMMGRSEWALRFPSVMAGAASVALLFYFVFTEIDRITARAAALCILLNEMNLWASREARMYAMMVLGVIVFLWLFVKLLKGEKALGIRVLFWLSGLAILLLHPSSVMVFLCLVGALFSIKGWEGVKKESAFWCSVWLPPLLLAIPGYILLFSLQAAIPVTWANWQPMKMLARSLTRLVSVWYGQYRIVTGDWFKVIGLAGIVWAVYRCLLIRGRIIRKDCKSIVNTGSVVFLIDISLFLFWGLALLLFLATINNSQFAGPQRYMVPALAPAVILQALTWRFLPAQYPKKRIGVLFLILLALIGGVRYLDRGVGLREGVGEVKRLLAGANPPVAVFYCPLGSPGTAFSYYQYRGPELVGIDGKIKDAQVIHDIINRHVSPGERFVVLHHRSEDALLPKFIEKDRRYHVVAKHIFRDTNIYLVKMIGGIMDEEK